MNDVVLAILAKDKEYCLDLYLKCILNQTFPKDRIRLWIRTNDNKDSTREILNSFITEHGHEYKSICYNSDDINHSLKSFGEHEWNSERFNILGKIREQSIEYAKMHNAHYIVVDCDNFIAPHVLQSLYDDRHLGVVGPLLRLGVDRAYANFHHKSCAGGYFEEDDLYADIVLGEVSGKIKVSTLHCTYIIPNKYLKYAKYIDGTGDWEYIVFSNSLKKHKIPQYIDNTQFQGLLYLEPFDLDRGYEGWRKEVWTDEINKLMGT